MMIDGGGGLGERNHLELRTLLLECDYSTTRWISLNFISSRCCGGPRVLRRTTDCGMAEACSRSVRDRLSRCGCAAAEWDGLEPTAGGPAGRSRMGSAATPGAVGL